MLLNAQIRLVIKQTIQHLGRVAHRSIDDCGVKRGELIRDVRVKRDSWLVAILRVQVASGVTHAARLEPLPIGR
jgi:hypothetical protein